MHRFNKYYSFVPNIKYTSLKLNNKNINIMKKVILTLTALFFTLLSFSQGIAVQGIARNDNNTARLNTLLTLKFEVYYRNGATEVFIYNASSDVRTDFFGVFSHVIDLEEDAGTVTEFGNQELWLRISEGTTVISEAKFRRVPYAYAASNGVPTGSIMPFIGTTAPVGWLLCNGDAIDIVPHTAALRSLLEGNNTPDLKAMFLRGTGVSDEIHRNTSDLNPISYEGPALNEIQLDANKSHSHDTSTARAASAGYHNPSNDGHNRIGRLPINGSSTTTAGGSTLDAFGGNPPIEMDLLSSAAIRPTPAHEHALTGYTATEGTEARPINYGVNYIIKL